MGVFIKVSKAQRKTLKMSRYKYYFYIFVAIFILLTKNVHGRYMPGNLSFTRQTKSGRQLPSFASNQAAIQNQRNDILKQYEDVVDSNAILDLEDNLLETLLQGLDLEMKLRKSMAKVQR